ncbi:MAG: helix-turn-helix domain-containing protein [Caulobacter sp.]|nr:helix-turn-helix domain-containing protein [Caulobacter sp.]
MNKNAFDKIMAGVGDMKAIVEGKADPKSYRVHVPAQIDVKAIRARTGLSQDRFANRFGFNAATLRDWEQGRRQPEPTARVLLTVIDREPEAVERALAGG